MDVFPLVTVLLLSFIAGMIVDSTWFKPKKKPPEPEKKYMYMVTFSVFSNDEEVGQGSRFVKEDHPFWIEDVRSSIDEISGKYENNVRVILHTINYLGEFYE